MKQTKKVVTKPQVVEQPKSKPIEVKKPKWEIKDRLYELTISDTPITYILNSRGILHFDEEKGYEREIKYCENQNTVFQDEMKGSQRLSHISFKNSKLYVPKEKQKSVIRALKKKLFVPFRFDQTGSKIIYYS